MKYVYIALLPLFLLSFLIFTGERDPGKRLSVSTHSFVVGLRIVKREQEKEKWVISAARADFAEDETTALLNSVTINAAPEGLKLTADTGTFNMTTKKLRLDNNINIRVKDSVISAKNLLWDPSKGILSSGERVRMENERFRIEGKGLTATEDQKVKLTNGVRATFY